LCIATPHQLAVDSLMMYKSDAPEAIKRYCDGEDSKLLDLEVKLELMTDKFKEMINKYGVKIISVVGSYSPRQMLQEHTLLGGLPEGIETVAEWSATEPSLRNVRDRTDNPFQDMCGWLTKIFGDILSHNKDWDPIVFPLTSKDPFSCDDIPGEGELKAIPTRPAKRPGSGDCWTHFSSTNEAWMTVSTTY